MKLLPALLLGAAFTASAQAADTSETPSEWTLLAETNGKAIYSTEVDSPALVLGCSDAGKISATFSLDGDVESKLKLRSARTRRINGTLTVGDGASETSKWAYLPTREMASPVDNRFARRLYNAVATGASVTLDLGRRGTYEFAPPKINGDFQTFATTCLAK